MRSIPVWGSGRAYCQETNEDVLVMWTDDIGTPEYPPARSVIDEIPEVRVIPELREKRRAWIAICCWPDVAERL